jgi:hypothetical protein
VAKLTRAGSHVGECSRDWQPAWPSNRKPREKHVNTNGGFFYVLHRKSVRVGAGDYIVTLPNLILRFFGTLLMIVEMRETQ